MKLRTMPLDKVVVGDRFRKDLGDITELAESIKAKGVIQPITVTRKGELLAGGRRLAAAREAGLTEIPVIERATEGELDSLEIELFENIHRKDFHWTEKVALEKRIYDLKKTQDPNWTATQQGEMTDKSREMVRINLELAAACEAIPELANAKGPEQAYKVLKKLEEKALVAHLHKTAGPAAIEAVKWAKDHYRVGDALLEMQRSKTAIADFAEVDPPYAVTLEHFKSRATGGPSYAEYNEITEGEYPNFVKEAAEEVFRLLKPNSFCVWWFGPGWYHEVFTALKKVGFKVNEIPAIWTKNISGQVGSPDSALGSAYEPFFICRKGDPKLARVGRGNVFNFDVEQKKYHPTQRPIPLMIELLETFTFPGARVLVPFLGSGVTLRAAYKANMTGWGYDLSDKHKADFLTAVTQEWLEGEEGAEHVRRAAST